MANIPIDPHPFVPPGFQIQQIEGWNGVAQVVLPRRPRGHEEWAIVTIQPLPDEVHFHNVREVVEEFLEGVEQVGHGSIHACPFDEAYVQFIHIRDKDRLIRQSPHAFGDVFLSFVLPDQGRNWRRLNFNRVCWLLIVGVPFDHCNTEDIAMAIAKFGRIINWEKEDARRRKVLVKARCAELIDIPKSIRWSEGEGFE